MIMIHMLPLHHLFFPHLPHCYTDVEYSQLSFWHSHGVWLNISYCTLYKIFSWYNSLRYGPFWFLASNHNTTFSEISVCFFPLMCVACNTCSLQYHAFHHTLDMFFHCLFFSLLYTFWWIVCFGGHCMEFLLPPLWLCLVGPFLR